MAAKVITITSGKGGVGKTTTSANLGVALASLGYKVVCMDADIGLRNLDVVLGLENRIVYDIVDIVEGRCRVRQAMIKDKRFPELYLIPAAQTRDKNALSPSDMINLCNDLRPEVDWIVINSPAGIERDSEMQLHQPTLSWWSPIRKCRQCVMLTELLGLLKLKKKGLHI